MSSASSKQTASFNEITSPSEPRMGSSNNAGVPSALFFNCIWRTFIACKEKGLDLLESISAHQHSYAVFVIRFKIIEFTTTNVENEICPSAEPEHYVKFLDAQQVVDELICIIVDSTACIFSSSPSSTPSIEISAFPSSSSITSLDVDLNSSSSTSELSSSKSLISPNFRHISSVSSKQTTSFNDNTSPSDPMGDSSYGAEKTDWTHSSPVALNLRSSQTHQKSETFLQSQIFPYAFYCTAAHISPQLGVEMDRIEFVIRYATPKASVFFCKNFCVYTKLSNIELIGKFVNIYRISAGAFMPICLTKVDAKTYNVIDDSGGPVTTIHETHVLIYKAFHTDPHRTKDLSKWRNLAFPLQVNIGVFKRRYWNILHFLCYNMLKRKLLSKKFTSSVVAVGSVARVQCMQLRRRFLGNIENQPYPYSNPNAETLQRKRMKFFQRVMSSIRSAVLNPEHINLSKLSQVRELVRWHPPPSAHIPFRKQLYICAILSDIELSGKFVDIYGIRVDVFKPIRLAKIDAVTNDIVDCFGVPARPLSHLSETCVQGFGPNSASCFFNVCNFSLKVI
uniref:Uncharacterized protein n=1 Tax=Glossina palpalis gambiensis TaxID=67801 RepID=A0A1B0BRH9_9MUSC